MLIRKSLALLLAITLCLGLTMTAFAAGTDESGSMTGDGTVEDTVYTVIVPTNLNFIIDPYMIKSTDNQLHAPVEFGFINKGDFDVRVGMSLQLTTGTGVTLVAGSALDSSMDTETAKKAYVAAMVSTVASSGVTFASTAVEESTFNSATTTSVIDFDANKKASFGFKLDKATSSQGNDTMDTLGSKGAGSFVMYGKLATYAGWKTSDLKVTGKYVLSPIRTGQVTTLLVGTHNAIAYTPPVVAGFQNASMTYSKASGGSTDFKLEGKTISDVYMTADSTNKIPLTTGYTQSGDTFTLVVNATTFGHTYYTVGSQHGITVEFSDETTSAISVNIAS